MGITIILQDTLYDEVVIPSSARHPWSSGHFPYDHNLSGIQLRRDDWAQPILKQAEERGGAQTRESVLGVLLNPKSPFIDERPPRQAEVASAVRLPALLPFGPRKRPREAKKGSSGRRTL